MKTATTLGLVIVCCLLVSCAKKTRSISQSGYCDHYNYAGPHSRELDELDVLGLNRGQPVTDEEILRVSRQAKPVQLTPGSTILLVQSGAMYPDGPMVAELGRYFRVVPFTGVAPEKESESRTQKHGLTIHNAVTVTDPDKLAMVVPRTTIARESYRTETLKEDAASYSRMLRLAAARAGAGAVVCYWGILESANEQIATKTISWIPVMNWFVFDERQHMRIRLKVAVIDVSSGNWAVLSPQPLENKRWSVRPRREVKDQLQVESLKEEAYALATRDLLSTYAGQPLNR